MSRLADLLMGMDRGASRPQGVGGIPRLTTPSRPSRKWLWGGLLVIVGGMLALPVGLVMRTTRQAGPAPVARPVPSPAPRPVAPPPARVRSDSQFVSLVARGLRAAEEGALPDAARLLGQALVLRPTHAETWNSLGVVLVREGEASAGIDAFRHALRFDPNHVEAHRNLAVALDRRGNPEEAATHYRAFLRLSPPRYPGRDDVRHRLAEVSGATSGRRVTTVESGSSGN
jgi:hypothetical protein